MISFRRIALGWQAACYAQSAAPPEPRFTITRFTVDGATLMTAEQIETVVRPFAGDGRTLGDVQRAREALEAACARLGYGATQVVLPEQEIKDGLVQPARAGRRSAAQHRAARA